MRILLTLGIVIVISINCNTPKTQAIKEETNFDLKSSDLTSILKLYRSLDKEVEYVHKKDTTRLELYLQIDEKSPVKRVSHYSDTLVKYFDCYNLIKNKSGQIIYVLEAPASESGDWELYYESYFDKDGNLVAFIRKCRFFNAECADPAIEESVYNYNLKHELIKKTYKIADDKGKSLDYTKCAIDYRLDYKRYTTVTEYLRGHKLEN
jgi:hypothetical protein